MSKTTIRIFLTGCLAFLVVACGNGKDIPPKGADHAEDQALAGADFQAGVDAYDHGDYETALKKWRQSAEQGDARAQSNLGDRYYDGKGVQQDFIQAYMWATLAAEQGLEPAVKVKDF